MPTRRRTTSVSAATRQLAEAKLASSALDLEDAEQLHISLLDPAAAEALLGQALPALRFDYLDPLGRPLRPLPGHPPLYRLRYLAEAHGFEQLTGEKSPRYVQPPGSGVAAYFPQNLDWPDLLDDPQRPLVITEGELKAASCAKHGYPAIGLGGVYSWRSLQKGVIFLPELEQVNWVGRHTYLVFDSDLADNPMVLQALKDLADQLVARGAFVYVVLLPPLTPEGGKMGVDDLLAAEGADALRPLLRAGQPIGLTQPLFELNKKYVYVRDPGLVLALDGLSKVSPAAFKDHRESVKSTYVLEYKLKGDHAFKPVSAAAQWLTWPLRREARRLTYCPGQPVALDDGSYNLWPGWGCQPKKGDVKLWDQLLAHLFQGAEPEARSWLERWLAYPLQHPGTKLFQSVVMHGIRHGTGKSLVAYTLGKIYGQNFTEISQADLHGGFNEWAENKQLVLGDDVTGSDKRADADLLKKLITQQQLRVNIKYVPSYVVPDCVNYFFTSNHPDAFFLEDDDRRFFIHEVTVPPLDEAFYKRYDKWLRSGEAGPALFHHLLKLDLGSFNPNGPALRTGARARMVADVQSDLGGWVRELLANPDHVLKVGEVRLDHDLATSRQLLTIYDPLGKTGVTANGLGRELRRAGVPMALAGRPLRLPDGSQGRYFILRDPAKWRGATIEQLQAHLAGETPARPKRNKF